MVRFVWDAHKSQLNRLRRGFDFGFASLIFEGLTLEREDTRRGYGERRIIAQGVADGLCLTVVYTDRRNFSGELERRIISARPCSRKERAHYAEAYPRTTEPGSSRS